MLHHHLRSVVIPHGEPTLRSGGEVVDRDVFFSEVSDELGVSGPELKLAYDLLFDLPQDWYSAHTGL